MWWSDAHSTTLPSHWLVIAEAKLPEFLAPVFYDRSFSHINTHFANVRDVISNLFDVLGYKKQPRIPGSRGRLFAINSIKS
jgi:hypothetical protein